MSEWDDTSGTPGSEVSGTRRPSPPGLLRAARVLACIQGVLTLLAAIVVLTSVVSRMNHNQVIAVLDYYALFSGFAVSVAMLVSAPLLLTRIWARRLILGLEIIAVVHGLLNVVYGFPQAVIGILLALFVLFILNKTDVSQWYADSRNVHGRATDEQTA